jgi:acyl-CoA reductase-like NAD-dependent aldehyde dehydrogenase
MDHTRGSIAPQLETESAGADEALSAAAAASPGWASLPARERRLFVRRLRQAIVAKQEEIVRAAAREAGKPITEVIQQEITAACEMLAYLERHYPRWLGGRKFRHLRPGFWLKSNRILFEPLGTIAVIGPANYPFSLPIMQTAAALIAGNTVVLKPSERCPETARLIRSLFEDAGFPSGVVCVCAGGAECGERLIASPVVRKVLFTGSARVGWRVAELCGRHFKPCLLELGGGQPAIVLDDADPVLAARGLAWSVGHAAGRSCIGTKAIFVHAAVKERFMGLLARELQSLRPGAATDASADVCGRPFLVDADELAPEALDLGQWPEGAVMVRGVTSAEQAVREADSPAFGLGASVWSRNLRRARQIAGRLHAGLVWINDSSVGLPEFPWGGTRSSGWGRLFSREALPELTSLKVVSSERRLTARRKFWWYPYSPEKFETVSRMNEFLYAAKTPRRGLRFLASLARLLVRSGQRP